MDRTKGAVVITGASTGIGATCALYLDKLGFQVFAGVRKEADAVQLRQMASSNLVPIFIDVTDTNTILAAKTFVAEQVHQAGIIGLINNAGIAVGGPIEGLPIADLRQQFEINVIGAMAVTQAFIPLLRDGQGRILNISSIGGRMVTPFFGSYSASKFALEGFTDALRLELRPWNIQVISIQPGSVDTPIWKKSLGKTSQLLDKFSPEMIQLYGDRFVKVQRQVKATGQRGIPSERVAQVVHKALTVRYPKLRYLIGLDAQMGALMVTFVPGRLQDLILSWLTR